MFPESSPPPPLLPPPLPDVLPPPVQRPWVPPVWSALVAPLIAIGAAVAFATLVQGVMMAADPEMRGMLWKTFISAEVEKSASETGGDRKARSDESRYPEVKRARTARDAEEVPQMPDFNEFSDKIMSGILAKPYGVAAMLVPGQLMLAVVALGAAALSPRRMRDRLGFVRSALPWWTLPLLILTTIFLGMVGGVVMDKMFPGPHPAMEAFVKMARSGSVEIALLNTALISLLPGIIEETLFRGYVQRRLLERWTPLAAVGVSSAFFCVSHLDPQHIIAIVPVGVWLGVVAWRSGSVWPGMLCHASMNALSFAMMRLGAEGGETTERPDLSGMAVVFAFGAAIMGLAIFLMWRYPPGRLERASAAAQLPVALGGNMS